MYNNNGVLVGNWLEERLKNEYELKLFLRKRERHELLLQRSRTLFSNLLKEKPLLISGQFLMYGYNVQVIASDIPVGGRKDQSMHGLALSSVVGMREVDYSQNMHHGCIMSLSPFTSPCSRNTFTIISLNDDSNYKTVKYGDQFFLKADNYAEPDANPLYVRYENSIIPEPLNRISIRLSDSKDTNCRWTAIPLMARDRLEGMGKPIMTSSRLIIKNCVADMNLCVLMQNWRQTFFGMECGVTCRNFTDRYKRITAENIFKLVSDIPSKSMR